MPARTARRPSAGMAPDCDVVIVVGSPQLVQFQPAGRGGPALRRPCPPGRQPGRPAPVLARRGTPGGRDGGGVGAPETRTRSRRLPGRARPVYPSRNARPATRHVSFPLPPEVRMTMGVPLRQSIKVGTYIARQKLAGPGKVPPHRRARAAVRLQPGVQRLRQDPVPDRDTAQAPLGRTGRRRHRGVRGTHGVDRRRRAAAAPSRSRR